MTTHTWIPDRLLLLRFGLPDPHAGKKDEVEEKSTTKEAPTDGDSYFIKVQKEFEQA
jgi:hypothetical protein